jgi:hypothetical protein
LEGAVKYRRVDQDGNILNAGECPSYGVDGLLMYQEALGPVMCGDGKFNAVEIEIVPSVWITVKSRDYAAVYITKEKPYRTR